MTAETGVLSFAAEDDAPVGARLDGVRGEALDDLSALLDDRRGGKDVRVQSAREAEAEIDAAFFEGAEAFAPWGDGRPHLYVGDTHADGLGRKRHVAEDAAVLNRLLGEGARGVGRVEGRDERFGELGRGEEGDFMLSRRKKGGEVNRAARKEGLAGLLAIDKDEDGRGDGVE